MSYAFADIQYATGFASGDEFTSNAEVREYFTASNIRDMFGECPYDQATLDEMAETVIANRWHYAGKE